MVKLDRDELRAVAARWNRVHKLLKEDAPDEEVERALALALAMAYPPKPEPGPEPANAHVPAEAAEAVRACMGLSADQVDVIMSLVSLPENGSSRWWDFYNYAEYGDDGAQRGYTTTIFGACSGTGSLLRVFDALATIDPGHKLLKYHDALRMAKGGSIKGLEGLAHVGGDPKKAKARYDASTPNGRTHLDHIEGDLARLPNDDPSWRRAVWAAFIDLNWRSAADFCAKRGQAFASRPGPVLTTPLAMGFVVDTSLNHGDARYWNEADTWKVVFKRMRNPRATAEGAWLEDFMEARRGALRSGYAGLDWSKSGDRCLLWQDLLRGKNHALARPIKVTSSKIWGKALVL